MNNTTIRILIADLQAYNQIRLTRLINAIGYSRVATVSSFRELLTMTSYSCEPFENFDVLLLSEDLTFAAGVDAKIFCFGNPQVKHALIYGSQNQSEYSLMRHTSESHQICRVRSLTSNSLYNFMSDIDKHLTKKSFSHYDDDRQIVTTTP